MVVIPNLSVAMIDSSRYLAQPQLNRFMDDMLRTRIGRRVLAEQHILLSREFDEPTNTRASHCTRIGIVDSNCHAGHLLKKCISLAQEAVDRVHGQVPEVVVDGYPDVTFLYVTDHIEYILFELLKNALHHQTKAHQDFPGGLPPIQVCLHSLGRGVVVLMCFHSKPKTSLISSPAKPHPPSSPAPFQVTVCPRPSPQRLHPSGSPGSLAGVAGVAAGGATVTATGGGAGCHQYSQADSIVFRISDQGGGIPKEILSPDEPDRIWSYHQQALDVASLKMAFASPERLAGKLSDPPVSPANNMKLGIQLARVFAQYWGGDVRLASLYGYGTDAYVKIVTSGEREERLTLHDGADRERAANRGQLLKKE